jgi:hypothetical protein
MNTPTHTPGPWTVNDSTENDDDTTLTICAPADEVEIATMSAYENGCECFSEIRANAHLIAAAPAMYEALQIMVRAANVDEIDPLVMFASIERAKDALAQAEGKP